MIGSHTSAEYPENISAIYEKYPDDLEPRNKKTLPEGSVLSVLEEG
jgi:hypothetical protein